MSVNDRRASGYRGVRDGGGALDLPTGPPKNPETIIFSGKYQIKFGNFVNVSGFYHRVFPLMLTELLRLCLGV